MDALSKACYEGDVKKVQLEIISDYQWLLQGRYRSSRLNKGLYYACKGGHVAIIELLISRGANDIESGMSGACESGHLAIVKLMISKGAHDWNWALGTACRFGHIAIVQFMLFQGAQNLEWGLRRACEGGHLAIVELLISKGATTNWNWALECACDYGQLAIVKFWICKGVNCDRVQPLFYEMDYECHMDFVTFLMKREEIVLESNPAYWEEQLSWEMLASGVNLLRLFQVTKCFKVVHDIYSTINESLQHSISSDVFQHVLFQYVF